MKTLLDRYGPWAVVTGASSGIGEVFAQRLAAAGLNLVIAARRIELLEALRNQLQDEHGIEVRCLEIDLSKAGGSARLIEACEDLVQVPKMFRKMALKTILKGAKAEGVTEITQEFAQKFKP